MTIFFVVSCAVQALSGFVVDRFGPRPVLFAGLALLGLAAFGFAASTSYAMLAMFSVVAGIGNGVFHPVDYTLLNRKVHPLAAGPCLQRARHHRQPGLGAGAGHAGADRPCLRRGAWRWCAAGVLALSVLAGAVAATALTLADARACRRRGDRRAAQRPEGNLDFLRIPAVWMCFAFFFFYADGAQRVQAFAPEAARHAARRAGDAWWRCA